MKILLLVALLTPSSLLAQQSGYSAGILEGISNRGENQGEPYVTAGDRAYVIGSQNGNFPDMGTHVPGEMGGVWVPAQTFNRKLPGSISEMMPDYGCLVQAWTMYGIVSRASRQLRAAGSQRPIDARSCAVSLARSRGFKYRGSFRGS